MPQKSDLPILSFKSPEAWEKWLSKSHVISKGVWIKIYKKDSGKPTVTYTEALDVALCYGWIDGQKDRHGGEAWLQRFTPRRPKSAWSKTNTGHAKRLIQEGRMKPAGHRQIEVAKKDGRWEKAYPAQGTAAYPEDFLREVNKNKKAKAFLKTLDSANRYAIIYRLHAAKKPETREKRLKQYVAMMAKGQKLHP
jgi:uncharacterized protein YdeI (YjbR/CyaY-like superfamily)